MIRTILVPATGTAADEPVFAAALTVARRFSAHLEFLHVRLDPAEVAASLTSDIGGGIVSTGLIDRLEQEAVEREAKAHGIWQRFCEQEQLSVSGDASSQPAVSVSWRRETGREPDWIAEYGRAADLSVIGRPAHNEGVAPETLEAALLDTGRPLLIPGPAPKAPAETLAIAWKSTREAARAVTAATPFIQQAKRVVILTISEKDRMDRDSAARLRETLLRHNGAVETRHLDQTPGNVGEALVTAASGIGAGLLVMGGYGHSRLREWVFGGVTEHVLHASALPVLVAH